MKKLPKGWCRKKLGEVTVCLDSKRIPLNANQRKRIQGEISYYGANGKIDSINKYLFNEELLLLAEDGGNWSMGIKCAYIISGKSWVNNHAHVLKVKPEINIKILEAFLNKEDLTNFISGSTRGKLTQEKMLQIPILIPPLEIQGKIVLVLNKIKSLIEKRKEANKNPDTIAKSLFFEMFGNPSSNSNGLDEQRLSDIAVISMGGTPSTKKKEYWKHGTVNWMKSGDIKGDFIKSIPQKITELGFNKSNTKTYKKGDVAIALNGQGKTRATTGILDIETTSNQSVASISPKAELNSAYLHFNLKYRYQELRDLTGDKQRSGLNLTLLRNLKIMLPPIGLQERFASLVTQIQNFKNKQRESTTEINKIYNSLIEKAVCV